jgi:small subunit ribosomal protein S1
MVDSNTEEEFVAPTENAVDDPVTEEAIVETVKEFNDGDILEGTVVRVDRDEVLVDVGAKSEGVIPAQELAIKRDVVPSDLVTVGDRIEAQVVQKADKDGRLILSKKRAQYERAWAGVEQAKERDEPIRGEVIEVVKGGLILDLGVRGFLPASLVEHRRVRDLQPYVGRTIDVMVVELDKGRNSVVVSRRAYLERSKSGDRTEFLQQLQKGQVRMGTVSKILAFGAFVDLGHGVDGLVHVSELSWTHVDQPGDVVALGQEVSVEVLDVDLARGRISLSLKATQEDPWRQFARTHPIGALVSGTVTKLVPFGVFVRVEDGIEGLVHISELANERVEVPEQVVQVGTEVVVKVIDIDLQRRRISLSRKQADQVYAEEFDPLVYGMTATYDDDGNYVYPEGFDSETSEWLPGYEQQREAWEQEWAVAHRRWQLHARQVTGADPVAADEAEPAAEGDGQDNAVATDEALAELRTKLVGA